MSLIDKAYKYISKFTYLVFLYGAGIFIPLYYEDYYFNMMEAKANAYSYLYKILLPLLLITFILKIIKKEISFNKPFLLVSLICLFISSLISTYTSFSVKYAIDGSQGWMVGFYVISTLILTIFTLKDVHINNRLVYIPVYITCFLIFSYTVLDTMEIDLLRMNEEIAPYSLHKYLTTLGNVNWIVGFLSLLLPFFVCMYLKENNTLYRILFFVVCVSLVFTFIVLDSDGIVLGIGFCAFFIIPYIFKEIAYVRRFSIILFLTSITIYLVKYEKIFLNFSRMADGFSAYIFKDYTIIGLFVVSILLFVVSYVIKQERYEKYKNIIIYSILSVLIIIVVLIIIAFFKDTNDTFSGGRLIIWEESMISYKEFNLHMKVFGTGPELLRNVYSYLSMIDGAIYNSSHSEPIQMLLTMGLAGLFSWIVCYGSIFYYYFKEKDLNKIPLYMGIFAYFGQSFVNSATIPNICVLSLFVILILNNERNIK